MNYNLGIGIFLLSVGMSGLIVGGITDPKSLWSLLGVFVILIGSIFIAGAFPKK